MVDINILEMGESRRWFNVEGLNLLNKNLYQSRSSVTNIFPNL